MKLVFLGIFNIFLCYFSHEGHILCSIKLKISLNMSTSNSNHCESGTDKKNTNSPAVNSTSAELCSRKGLLFLWLNLAQS